MKRAVAIAVTLLMSFVLGNLASAQPSDATGFQQTGGKVEAGLAAYPPSARIVTGFPAFGPPGYQFRASVSCLQGETITFTFGSSASTVTCRPYLNTPPGTPTTSGSPGVAFVDFIAPTTPGTYVGSVSGDSVPADFTSFTIFVNAPAVEPNSLPTTGSEGISTITLIAVAVFVMGAGLFGVARYRRWRGLVH